ncbi:hypothetical protein ACN27G_29305 [Plantactinospora sp. WMMB334]|uniref:hypothetical protein n=1 Tax=Plantactinospora sp. WMMB334 TaxID=3404119 RepID=UPI003B932321
MLDLVAALTADVAPAGPSPSTQPVPTTDATPMAVAAPPPGDASTGIRLSPAAYVAAGLCLLVTLTGVGVLGGVLVRARLRRPVADGPPGPGYPSPHNHALSESERIA